MAYSFRLEALLTIRRRRLELAEMELARLLKEHSEIKNKLRLISEEFGREKRRLEKDVTRGLMADEYRLRMAHLDRMGKELESRRRQLSKCELDIQRARRELAARHKEMELVERLKQKDFMLYLDEQRKEEQKELDELATVMYARKNL